MKSLNIITAVMLVCTLNVRAQYSTSWHDPALHKQIENNIEKYRKGDAVISKVVAAVGQSTRDTDLAGWYEDKSTIGIIFTEVAEKTNEAVQAVLTRVTTALSKRLDPSELNDISITCHLYPEATSAQSTVDVSVFYPGQTTDHPENRRVALVLKRAIDIAGSTRMKSRKRNAKNAMEPRRVIQSHDVG